MIPYAHPAIFALLESIIFREDKYNMMLSRLEPRAFTPVPPQAVALAGTLVSFFEVDLSDNNNGHIAVEVLPTVR